MTIPKLLIVRSYRRILIGEDTGEKYPGPLPAKVRACLADELTMVEIQHLRGKELYEAKKRGYPIVREIPWECFDYDFKERLCTSFGFLERIQSRCASLGWPCRYVVLQSHPNPSVFEPDWDRVFTEDFTPRHAQEDFLVKVFTYEDGRYDCPTGWGKSAMIGRIALGLSKAKIAVVAKPVPVVLQRIYPELCGLLPSVGIIGGGMKRPGRRVMCYTADSLHHCPDDVDMLIFDEGHQAAADGVAYELGKFKWARMISFSASWDMRLDNKNLRCEAIFGPIRMHVSYQEGVDHKMIVPIEVVWRDVIMDEDPCEGYIDVAKKRHGIWRNEYRNSLIAEDARKHGDQQVLITCEVLEHVLALKKLIPEACIIYHEEGMESKGYEYFERHKLIPPDFREMTSEKKLRRIRNLESGVPGIYIATTVLNVGVDLRYLEVLCRADAGGSADRDVQIPGRVSRRNDRGKEVGIIYDYLDQFNKGFRQRASGRARNYELKEWQQEFPEKLSRRRMRRTMERKEP